MEDQGKTTKTPEKGRGRENPCKTMRLAIVVGSPRDEALDGAIRWVLERARALGGDFRLWGSRSNSSPLASFRDFDINGGTIRAGSETYREHPSSSQRGYEQVLADLRDCRGRIEELVIFHHGSSVDEAEVGDRLLAIFRAIQVPVCRVVWWACNASVSLDVSWHGWTAAMMRGLGGVNQCEPCGCDAPIELIWPTAGRCYLSGAGAADAPQTNDGKAHRVRWGWRHGDGELHPQPPPDSHVTREPGDRDPPADPNDPRDENIELPRVDGTVFGTPVAQR